MVLVTHASAPLGLTVYFTEFSPRCMILFQATFILINDSMILAKVQNVCTFILRSFSSLFIFKKKNFAMMCNWYSYIFLSLTSLYSCTFGCSCFRHCITIVTSVVGCCFGVLHVFLEPGTCIAVLKLQRRSLALKL